MDFTRNISNIAIDFLYIEVTSATYLSVTLGASRAPVSVLLQELSKCHVLSGQCLELEGLDLNIGKPVSSSWGFLRLTRMWVNLNLRSLYSPPFYSKAQYGLKYGKPTPPITARINISKIRIT